jgi:hypothetical protein
MRQWEDIPMRRVIAVVVMAAAGCLCATTAFAQMKVTGTMACGKPDPQQMVPVGDRPEHALGVEQFKCNWTKPMQLGTDKSKDGLSTDTVEADGNKAHTRGNHVTAMQSGDKLFVAYQGTTTTKDGAPLDSRGTWAFTGGTGKLEGIKGKGTYSCSPWAGGLNCEIVGDYQLAK